MRKKLITALILFILLFCCINGAALTYGDLTYTVSNGEVTITGCNTSVTEIEIPEEIDGYPVTAIGNKAFSSRGSISSLISINIPDSVTSIGASAFYNCSGLTSINIPDNVTSIGSSAFAGCSSLTSINSGQRNFNR